MKYENIIGFYRNKIINCEQFNSLKPIRDVDLLFPDFFNKLVFCFNEYKKKYFVQSVFISESFRSKNLENKCFKDDKRKAGKYSMHHFGIAADVAFLINDKISFKGDFNLLRKIFKENKLTVIDSEINHVQFIPVSEEIDLFKEIENLKLEFRS